MSLIVVDRASDIKMTFAIPSLKNTLKKGSLSRASHRQPMDNLAI